MAWLSIKRDDSNSVENRERNERVASERLKQITAPRSVGKDEDPADVEARLRNLKHGTSGT